MARSAPLSPSARTMLSALLLAHAKVGDHLSEADRQGVDALPDKTLLAVALRSVQTTVAQRQLEQRDELVGMGNT